MAFNSSDKNISFQLLPKYAPGTDLMSKGILNDKKVINLIVKSVIGEHAENEYETKQTEWTKYTRSDVVYCPVDPKKSETLPAVLIGVHYTVDGDFLRRLIEYCLMIRKQYSMLPVAVIICINNTSQEFKELTYECKDNEFNKRVHCQGWAQEVYYISAETLSPYLNQRPLHPLNALGYFLTAQKLSILDIKNKDDETVQMLCEIAARVYGDESADEAADEEAKQTFIDIICSKPASQIKQAMSFLMEDVPEISAQKRTRDCLQDGLDVLEELHTKYRALFSPSVRIPVINDWQFINDHKKEYGTKMNWVTCYAAGKNSGLFSKYSSLRSLQAAYYRANKK